MTSETYLSNQKNIGKLVLHKAVRPIGAEIWPFQFPVAAILDFLHNSHQGSPPTCCVRWFLKTLYPYLTVHHAKFKKLSQSARFLQIVIYIPSRYRVLCHSDWLFHGQSCPRLNVVHPGRAWSSMVHLALFLEFYLFLQATPLFRHGVTIVC